MNNYYLDQGNFYDKYNQSLTPEQVLGIQDMPMFPQPTQAMQQMSLQPSPLTQSMGTLPISGRPSLPQYPPIQNARSTGTLSFDGPETKTAEQAQADLLKHLNIYPEDAPNFINDFYEGTGNVPSWLNDFWNQFQSKNPQGRPGSMDVPLMQGELLQPPMTGYLNQIVEKSRPGGNY